MTMKPSCFSKVLRVLCVVLTLACGFPSAQALTVAPNVDLFSVNSGPSTTSMRAVTPGPDGSFYLVALGNTAITQGGVTLATGGGSFSSLILKAPTSVVWTRNFASNIEIWDTHAMPDGGIVMAGDFTLTAQFPVDGSNFQSISSQGQRDVFIVRYDPLGNLVWLRTFGSTTQDHIAGLTVDETGNLAVAGSLGANATVETVTGIGAGLFTAKYSEDGTFQWVNSVAGAADATGLTADPAGDWYVLGTFSGSINVSGTPLTASGGLDALLIKYSSTGTVAWACRAGGTLAEATHKVRTFKDDGVVIEGTFNGTATFGTTMLLSSGGSDGFVSRLDKNGNWIWTIALPSSGQEIPIGLGVDLLGNSYIGGYFDISMPLGTTNLLASNPGSLDSFIIRLNPSGVVDWAVRLDGVDRQNINNLRILGEDEGYYWGDFVKQVFHAGTPEPATPLTGTLNNGFYGVYYANSVPKIVLQPVTTYALPGTSATFRVRVSTFLNLSYQWYKNGDPIPGATKSTYTLTSVSAADEQDYSVKITNANGSVDSDVVQFRLGSPAAISEPVASRSGPLGGAVTNTVNVTGLPLPVVQWRRVGGPVLHTGATFIIDPIDYTYEGEYEAVISNQFNTIISPFRLGVDLIPVDSFAGMVHDPYRDVVYLSSGTNVLRYDMLNKMSLPPIALSGNLRGLDVSPDGKWLVVADNDGVTASNWVHIVNLDNTQVSKVLFERAASEGFTESVAFGSDGRAVISSNNRLRSLNVTNETDVVTRTTTSAYRLTPSASRELIALSGADAGVYSVAQTNLLAGTYNTSAPYTSGAVEWRQNQSVAVSTASAAFLSTSRQLVQSVGDGSTSGPIGAAYHPFENLVYLPWLNTSQIRVYSSDTFTEVTRYTSGTSQYVPVSNIPVGQAQVSRSGDMLFVAATNGVRYVRLPVQLPLILGQPKALRLSPGFTAKFKVTAYSGHALSYQWQKDEQDILGANGAEYEFTVPEQVPGDAGSYRVKVTNTGGTVISDPATLTILKHDPGVAWATPAAINYGELLPAGYLNATAVAPGTFVYSTTAGTKLGAGQRPLQVIFTPNDTVYYETVTNTVYLTVHKRRLTYAVGSATRMYGLPNSAVPLNVSGFITGESLADVNVHPSVVSPATETSPIGTYPMTYTGGSDDNYSFAYGTGTLTVTKRTVAIALSNTSQAFNGSPRTITATPTPPEAPLQILYNGSINAPTAIGNYPVAVSVTSTNYQGSTTGTLSIFKGGAAITWNPPAPVLYGTVVGAAQFNAVAAVQGIYQYSPPAGTVLGVGTHTLQLIFTPLDTANYLRTTNTVTITITTPTLVQPEQVTGSPGTFRFGFGTVNGKQYEVQASDNLVDWTTVTTLTATGTSLQFNDANMFSHSKRFYRIVPKP